MFLPLRLFLWNKWDVQGLFQRFFCRERIERERANTFGFAGLGHELVVSSQAVCRTGVNRRLAAKPQQFVACPSRVGDSTETQLRRSSEIDACERHGDTSRQCHA